MSQLAGYWTRFARRSRLIGGVQRLENPALPMLEVNALYGDSALEQPIVIRSRSLEGSGLEGYELAGALVALEFLPAPMDSSLWVEQVAWTQASRLASVWCDCNDAGDWRTFVTRELARSLEAHPELLAYIAYEADDEVGMMIVSSDGLCGLWAGADDVALTLFARGAHDLGRLTVCVPLERRGAFNDTAFHDSVERGRFGVWMRRHQPSDAQTSPPSDP